MKTIKEFSLCILCLIFFVSACKKKEVDEDIIKDIDGNVYHSVKIGNQVWMVENLSVVHYRNGDPIPNVTNGNEWGSLTTGAYCDYDNNPANASTYGHLYNAHAVLDPRNVAPEGWHVATDADYKTLEAYLGGLNVAGGKMKEAGTTHWIAPNTGATNESGFSGLPGGIRGGVAGTFASLKERAYIWSSTPKDAEQAYGRILQCDKAEGYITWGYRMVGLSVRCIKD